MNLRKAAKAPVFVARLIWRGFVEVFLFVISIPISVLFGIGYAIMKADEFLDGEK